MAVGGWAEKRNALRAEDPLFDKLFDEFVELLGLVITTYIAVLPGDGLLVVLGFRGDRVANIVRQVCREGCVRALVNGAPR
jgi:hypothetical protein